MLIYQCIIHWFKEILHVTFTYNFLYEKEIISFNIVIEIINIKKETKVYT